MGTAPPNDGQAPKSPDRSGPRLLLLPLAILVGIVVSFATLGVHQDAVRPTSSSVSQQVSAHSARVEPWRAHGLQPAVQYFRGLVRHLHI
jgi:hypothetical protein